MKAPEWRAAALFRFACPNTMCSIILNVYAGCVGRPLLESGSVPPDATDASATTKIYHAFAIKVVSSNSTRLYRSKAANALQAAVWKEMPMLDAAQSERSTTSTIAALRYADPNHTHVGHVAHHWVELSMQDGRILAYRPLDIAAV